MQGALRRATMSLRSRRCYSTPSAAAVVKRPPLFQRYPPWWARWTWALVACDIFLTRQSGSAVELTWNHWSKLVKDLENISIKNASSESDASDSPPPPVEHFVMRPTWQRLGLCVAHLGLGVGCAVALVVTQMRFVRTFAILPPSLQTPKTRGDPRRVFIQCAHNWRGNGKTFPLSRCSLEQGRNETEMILRVADEKGHWYVGLDDALVNGQRASTYKARDAILAEWGNGKRVGTWTRTPTKTSSDTRWKNGPVSRAN